MTRLTKWLIAHRMTFAAYLLWFLAIPVVLLIGAAAGIFSTAQEWRGNLEWIKRQSDAQKAKP